MTTIKRKSRETPTSDGTALGEKKSSHDSCDIVIKNLSYTYPDGTEALFNIDLSIKSKESVAILGKNGAGKSTLLHTLPGLIMPKGEIEISGIRLTEKSVRDIRKKIGIVFQNPEDQLFCPTVYEDVAFGPNNMGLDDDEIDRRVRRAISAMGLSGLESRSAHHLSHGEKKRAALATILSMEPDIVAFDEPAANLDPEGVHSLKKIICGIDKTKLIITHNINLASDLATRAVVMDGGRIVADMPIGELISDKKRLKELKLLFD
ncbi:MAG: ABC transporter ATP-binding protein [Deltaproteobacteria bacterium]|uniref:ABC transporter ATP-binding protein n=1 Tax=Candidatus Zymogenus saltonus TaxID=2844893 RepID=A0A9D8KD39_9DELT|nr:ABC transporter ATP-binding protein [Candidatus Zymogenus saltonus]